MLLIQVFRVHWDKSSWGAPEGAERRALPEVESFAVDTLPEAGEIWLHTLGTGRPAEKAESNRLLELPDLHSKLEVRWVENSVTVYQEKATVYREFSLQPVLSLARGETGRVRIQGRVGNYDTSWYQRNVIHLAWLERFDAEVFRLRPLTKTYDDLPNLRVVGSNSPVQTPRERRLYGKAKKGHQPPSHW